MTNLLSLPTTARWRTVLATALLPLALAALWLAPAHAGPGHDHGPEPAPASGPALPRFAAESELFELVGVLDGRRLTLWLDRAADNAPVTDATIELEVAGAPLKLQRHDDVFEAELAAQPAPGSMLPVTATVTVGAEVDLLAADLALPAVDAAAATGGRWVGLRGAAVAVAGALLLAALLWALRRAVTRRRAVVGGGAA